MLPTNISKGVERILQNNNGWMRVQKCAKAYARGNASRRTRFYRWRKKVEKNAILGFQVVSFPKNISFIGLDSADPKALRSLLPEDQRAVLQSGKGMGFFDWLKYRSERKKLEQQKYERELLAQKWTYLELLAKAYPVAKMAKEWAELEKSNRKLAGLNNPEKSREKVPIAPANSP